MLAETVTAVVLLTGHTCAAGDNTSDRIVWKRAGHTVQSVTYIDHGVNNIEYSRRVPRIVREVMATFTVGPPGHKRRLVCHVR